MNRLLTNAFVRRITSVIALSAILAACLGLVANAEALGPRTGWLVAAKQWAGAMLPPAGQSALGNIGALVRRATPHFGGAAQAQGASITTDKADYAPLSQVTITGAGFLPGEVVELLLTEVAGDWIDGPFTYYATADADGAFTNTDFWTDLHDVGVKFNLVATGAISGYTAKTSFTDAVGNLDQCANGSPTQVQCAGSQWVNGNVGSSKAQYVEGDYVSYRFSMAGIAAGTHSVTFEYDTTKSGKHAIDYLGTFNKLGSYGVGISHQNQNANPCDGIAGCTYTATGPYTFPTSAAVSGLGPGTYSTFNIPADPNALGYDTLAGDRVMTLFGGTITDVTAPAISVGTYAGDSSTQVTITFTIPAGATGPVLAWGGHIARRTDWGINSSANTISGSPYHMRLVGLDGSGGNTDRSLSAGAVVLPATITVTKIVSNGPSNNVFGFTASNSAVPATFSLSDDGVAGHNTTVLSSVTFTGTTTIAETSATSPALNTYNTAVACTGESVTVNNANRTASFTAQAGGIYICTFTNSPNVSTLILKKHVDNGTTGGTAVASDWQLSAAGPTPSSAPGSEAGTTFTVAGGVYALSESAGPAGYTASAWSCVGGSLSGSNLTINSGQTATCTITNTATAPKLTVTKVVVNTGGGTKVVSDFPLKVDAASVTSGVQISSSAGSHTVSETSDPNYTSAITGDCAANGSVTLAFGDAKACTITNTFKAPSITVTKVVVNTGGGTKVVGDFTLKLDATTVASGVQTATTAGAHTVSEVADASYTSAITGDCAANGSITLAAGDNKACTITNTFKAPKLTVNKVVVNTGGGTKVAGDFALNVDGSGVTNGIQITSTTGAHTVGETADPNYTSAISGDCAANGSITLAAGDVKVCTITNTFKAPKLTVTKVVVNTGGGTKVVGDFSLNIDGTGVTSGAQNASTTGAHTVGEVADPSYTSAISGDCAANGSITLAAGDVKACTITNTFKQPKLTVTKVVVNTGGGTKVVGDFSLNIDGTGVTSGAQNASTTGAHTVGEVADPSYTSAISGDCTANGNITLAAGDVKACTITNTFKAPKLTVNKVVVNTGGGTKVVGDFSLKIDGTGVTSGVQNASTTGAHTVAETADPNYDGVISGDCAANGSITLAAGDAKVCTITNTFKQPHLTVTKSVINHGGTKVAADFAPYKIDAATVALSTSTASTVGVHAVTEAVDPTYTATFGGACDASGHVTLAAGDNKTCSITNEEKLGTLTLNKIVVNNNGGTAMPAAWLLSAAGPSPISGQGSASGNVNQGVYTLSESGGPAGYATQGWSCVGGSLDGSQLTIGPGQSASCSITNDDIAPSLALHKNVTNYFNTATPADWALSGNGPTPISGQGNASSGGNFLAGSYTLNETGPAGYTSNNWICTGNATVTGGNAPNYSAAVLGKNPTAYWKLNESGGWVLADASGNLHPAILPAVQYGIAGAIGGTSTGISVDHSAATLATPITMFNGAGSLELWIRPEFIDPAKGYSAIMQEGFDGFGLWLENTGSGLHVGWYDSNASGRNNTALFPGALYHIALTVDGSGTGTFYVNGVADGTVAGIVPTALDMLFSADYSLTASYLNATLVDEIALYDGANLSAAQVANHYGLGFGGNAAGYEGAVVTDGTTAFWKLDELVGNVLADATGNGHTLTLPYIAYNVPGAIGGGTTGIGLTHAAANIVNPIPLFAGAGSVEFWIRPVAIPASKQYSAILQEGADGFGIWLQDVGSGLNLGWYDANTTGLNNTTLTPGQLYHVVLSVDAGGNGTWYLNGVPDGTFSGAVATTVDMLFSADYSLTASFLETPLIDELAIYGSALSSGDVSSHYALGTSGNTIVTLAAGQSADCTVTNVDQLAHLKLVKHVSNVAGGNAAATDWTLTAGGPTPISGITGTAAVDKNVVAGTYQMEEGGNNGYASGGYSAGNWTCAVDGGQSNTAILGLLRLLPGQTAVCEITNFDSLLRGVQGKLTLIKHIDATYGGPATLADFPLSAAGPTPITGVSGTAAVTAAQVNPGTYTLSEPSLAGYTSGTWTCNGKPNAGSITLGLGQSATCEITNTARPGTLTVNKVVVNNNGGTKTASNFSFKVNGGAPVAFTQGGNPLLGSNVLTVSAGTYNVTEPATAGYTQTGNTCVNVVVTNGGSASCTITNDDNLVGGVIAPTSESCSTFTAGTILQLNQANYTVNGGKIGQNVNPGVFFYFSNVTVAAGQIVSVVESVNETAALFGTKMDQAYLYNTSCGTVASATTITNSTATFGAVPAGSYIVGIKYDSKSISGTPAPTPSTTAHYTFQTKVNGVTTTQNSNGLDLVKQ